MKYSVLFLRHFLFLFLFIQISIAFEETQTDWSGGDGILGPANHWFDTFYTSDTIEYIALHGNLLLTAEPLDSPEIFTLWQSNPYYISIADINNDGNPDIICTYYQSNDILWFENADGLGLTWTEHEIETNFSGAKTADGADIDGDGDIDVIGSAFTADEICWFENIDGTGTSWDDHAVNYVSFDGAHSACAADIDADGYMDIVGCAASLNDITWWKNVDGSGTNWIEYNVDSAFNGARSVQSADIDGDGDYDIIAAGRYVGAIYWWENADGIGTNWIEHIITDIFADAISVFPCDINGDGYMDVLGAAMDDDDIKWWENTDGTGTLWQEHSIDWSFDGVISVCAADMEGDGDLDVIGAAATGDEVAWWENEDGIGTSWDEHYIDFFDNAYSVATADLNSSGYLDVVCCSFLEDEFAWWEVYGYPESGYLESTILNIGMNQTDWGDITWNSEIPDSTEVTIQVRASDDYSNMGNWSDSISVSGTALSGYLDPFVRFFQYRVSLQSALVTESPILNTVTIEWFPYTDIQDLSTTVPGYSFTPAQNPVRGDLILSFRTPATGQVLITIHDISGRNVRICTDDEFTAGSHTARVDGLPTGVYICRIAAGEFRAAQRVIVL